ncbi:MAG TPA: hypothetical protein VIO15_02275 [Bacteroidales bacterium]
MTITLGVITFSGCTKYQYITLSGNVNQNESKAYVFENDTVKVVYSFNGNCFPMSFEIYNKSNFPLYIDWSKSSAIVNGHNISLWKDIATINASSSSEEYKFSKNFTYSNSDITGTMAKSEQVTFVAPKSFIQRTPVYLRSEFIKQFDKSNKVRKNVYSKVGKTSEVFYYFKPDSTPMTLRCFLTFSLKDNKSEPFYIQNEFWVSSISNTMLDPENLMYKPSNQVYLQDLTGFGAVAWTVTILGVIVITCIAKAQQ